MRIVIEQEHIDKGLTRAPGLCPVALAVLEQTYAKTVSVGIEDVGFLNPEGFPDEWFSLPPDASAFIDRFDKGLSVYPFSFDLKEE